MELKFITTGKKVELTNCLLAYAIEGAQKSNSFKKQAGFTDKDLNEIESFRKQMINGYLRKPRKKSGKR